MLEEELGSITRFIELLGLEEIERDYNMVI